MGGTIKLAVRFSDGSVHADTRHTNAIPYWIRHPRFIEGDEAWFRTYVEQASEYREGDHTMSPVSYGVIVVDFLKKDVYVANTYSRLEDTVLSMRAMMSDRFGIGDDDGVEVFEEMLSKGYLSIIQYTKKKGRDKPLLTIPLTGITQDEWDEKVWKYYQKVEDEDVFFFGLLVNFSDWTFRHYADDLRGHRTLRDDMRSAGFTITPEDDAKFEEWCSEYSRSR